MGWKDRLTRRELVEALEVRIVTITYTPESSTRCTRRLTLMPEILSELDNRPIGFYNDREAAFFDEGAINAVDIDSNSWETILVSEIQRVEIP